MQTTQSKQTAAAFIQACHELGFWIEVKSETVIAIHASFTPGDAQAFARADMNAFGLLNKAPLSGGSVWGTDGGSVGGAYGLQNGVYTLNKSGYTGKRFVAAVAKLVSK